MTPAEGTATFLIDTNVLVAAIKRLPRRTYTLDLLVSVASDEAIMLVASPELDAEWRRYAALFASEAGQALHEGLRARTRIVAARPATVALVAPFIGPRREADVSHAATCLESGAILVTSDRDFRRLAESRLVEVWTPPQMLRWLNSR